MRLFAVVLFYFTCLLGHSQHMCSHRSGGGAGFFTDPGNSRSDSIDVANYGIYLDMTEMDNGILKGHCDVLFSSKIDDLNELHLDLQALTVDSVLYEGNPLAFTHLGFSLKIHLSTPMLLGESRSIRVYYGGNPDTDAIFGGFYHQGNYAYNLGVGFIADPHNFGRAWFPCVDNFVERSTYTINVLTNEGRTAYCGGLPVETIAVGQDSLLTLWHLSEEIPTYLASVAVSDYTHVDWSYEKQNGETVPVYLASRAADTTAFKGSMVNLLEWLDVSESLFGEYQWSRAGYVAVPFNGGAMEHATNIAYPLFAIDGTDAFGTLMAHELSHHWWGDLVTCETAEDMWLNEGWASYNEALYLENIYDYSSFRTYMRANHKDVLQNAHDMDGGYYPVAGVPHELVYGAHVYNKGALVAHSLRGYMGDEAFFQACTDFLSTHAFTSITSLEMRDFFQLYTDKNLTSFFNQWVFAPGFPEFRIHHWEQNGEVVQLDLESFTHNAPEPHTNIPIEVTLTDWAGNTQRTEVVLDDSFGSFEIPLTENFNVVSVLLNQEEKITPAILPETRIRYTTGIAAFNQALMDVNVQDLAGNDSVIIHIENHWATAHSPAFIPGTDLFVSPDRWWLVDGKFDGAQLRGTIRFYGSETNPNYFDPQFFTYLETTSLTENDIKCFYRVDGTQPWQEWSDYSIETLGNNTNWDGRVRINNMQKGQYCFGVNTGVIGLEEQKNALGCSVYTDRQNQLHIQTASMHYDVRLYDRYGRLVKSALSMSGNALISLQELATGTYSVVLKEQDGTTKTFHIFHP